MKRSSKRCEEMKKKVEVVKEIKNTKERIPKKEAKKANKKELKNLASAINNENIAANPSPVDPPKEMQEVLELSKCKVVQAGIHSNSGEVVYLKCVKEGSKLRIKIITPGYYNDANCQFPKDIRKEGCLYSVSIHNVILATSVNGKYFYRVNTGIKIVNKAQMTSEEQTSIKVFEDKTMTDCAICMCEPKSAVIVPCGHFYTCMECSTKIDKCPICRGPVTKIIDKSKMD